MGGRMTVESSKNKAGPFHAAGPSGTFPRDFLLIDADHLRVIRVRDEVETDLSAGISHTGIGTVDGTVTITAGIQAGDQVYLLRSVPKLQRSDYSAQGRVRADQVESDFDILAMQVQDLNEVQGRGLTIPVSSNEQGPAVIRAALEAPRHAAAAKASEEAAEVARDGAETARTGAEAARTTANAHATNAQTFRNQAQDARDAAAISATNAATSEANANADAAATAADRVQTGLDRAASEPAAVTATTQAGIATAKAAEAAASAALANGMPPGTIMHFAADTPPDGWLVCDGTAVTSLYPDLRSFLIEAGSPFGDAGGDPLLPDLRGEFVRGWDGGRGVDAGRVFGSMQLDQMQRTTGDVSIPAGNTGNFSANLKGSGAFSAASLSGSGRTAAETAYDSARAILVFDSAGSPGARTGPETRPRNIALLPCIRAYASIVNVPGQADLDNILQQTQVQANAAVTWRRVGKANVGTGAAVTITGLDLTKETLFVVSYVKNNGTAARDLRIRASEDGGASWLPALLRLSASANWSAGILRGAMELLPDTTNGAVITSTHMAGAEGASATQSGPVEISTSTGPILTPSCDTVEFYWSAGGFAASGAAAPETDCIIIYQRG